MTAKKVAIITAGGSGMSAGAARKPAQDGFDVAILSLSGNGRTAGWRQGRGSTVAHERSEDGSIGPSSLAPLSDGFHCQSDTEEFLRPREELPMC